MSYFDMGAIYSSDENLGTKYWINPITDTVFSFLSIIKGELSIIKYLSSIVKKDLVNALFVKDDMRPGWKYLANIFSIKRNR